MKSSSIFFAISTTTLCVACACSETLLPPTTQISQPVRLITAETFSDAESLAPKGKPGWRGGIGEWNASVDALLAKDEKPSANRPNGHEAVCEYVTCTVTSIPVIAGGSGPNIVFILADDLGYGDLSCYGQQQLKTPNLDKLASEGLRFTRHYAGMTVCSPSRCVLMTGKHSGRSLVRTNWDPPLPDGTKTIASLLKEAGYKTGAFGKWGIGNVIPEDDPLRKGFDTFYGYVDMFHAHNFFPPFLVRDGKREPLDNDLLAGSDAGPFSGRGNGVAANPRDYAPEIIRQEALSFIDQRADDRFFLYLALNTPHANNEGGKGEYKRGMEVPTFGEFANRDWPDEEKGFAWMLQQIDKTVAAVVAKLHQHKLAEKTLVIFTSDNGPHQEGGHKVDFFDSNGQLKGQKRDLYEGGIRVPTIAWWPGQIMAGEVSDQLSGFQDWLPTFSELAGVKSIDHDGVSLVPTLQGHNNEQKDREGLYFEFYEGGGKQAIVTDRWKAVRLNWIASPNGPLELYDLQNDPGEEVNVAAKHPDIVMSMDRDLAKYHTDHPGKTPPPTWGSGSKQAKSKQ